VGAHSTGVVVYLVPAVITVKSTVGEVAIDILARETGFQRIECARALTFWFGHILGRCLGVVPTEVVSVA